MYIHRALVGPRTPHLYTIYIYTDFYVEVHKRMKCQAAQKIVCVVKIKRNFIFLHCILAYLLTIYIIYLLL